MNVYKPMGVIRMYVWHEFNFVYKKNNLWIRARNTSDAVLTPSLGYKLKKIPIFFFCSHLSMYLLVIWLLKQDEMLFALK